MSTHDWINWFLSWGPYAIVLGAIVLFMGRRQNIRMYRQKTLLEKQVGLLDRQVAALESIAAAIEKK